MRNDWRFVIYKITEIAKILFKFYKMGNDCCLIICKITEITQKYYKMRIIRWICVQFILPIRLKII